MYPMEGPVQLDVFKTLWGAVGEESPYGTFADVIPRVAGDGFEGVVFALINLDVSPGIGTLDDLASLCGTHQLDLVTMVMTFGSSVDEHLATLRRQFEMVAPLPNRHVVCLGGSDAFTAQEAKRFFRGALAMEQDFGLTVAHETHRGRVLFSPWDTDRILDQFDDLRLACDFSHWVVVCERLIDDQIDIIRRCGQRAIHVDCRVGYEEGPQVPDPRAPEWADHVAAHERWWDLVWDAQEARGLETSIMVPEFGPPPYQQTLAYSGEPTSDLWEMCNWMAARQRERFAARSE
ncbi:MAG: sugar phosphate isomerase/epimerase family protein [Acidimicrobiia bacterium]